MDKDYLFENYIVKNRTEKEIAGELFIAESTVKSTMKTIFNKLNINKRQDLMNFFKEK